MTLNTDQGTGSFAIHLIEPAPVDVMPAESIEGASECVAEEEGSGDFLTAAGKTSVRAQMP